MASTPGRWRILPLADAHVARVHEINQAAVPAVGDASREHLVQLVEWSSCALVAELDRDVVGFVLALRPGSAYGSPNYRWFSERYHDFIYVDRIAVRPEVAGRGIGRGLYTAVAREHADAGVMTCEVNVRPLNADSLAFHDRLGFSAVGEQETYGGTVRVRLLARPLAD